MKAIKPTESELEILKVLWEHEVCTVREVYERLAKTKEIGYTTVLKLMQIMHTKGLLERDETSKTHVYKALVSRKDTEQQLVTKVINDLFDGSAARLVLQALGNHKASSAELDKIKQLLNELDTSKKEKL